MMAPSIAVIGNWYRKPGGGLFEVVAIDEDDATIEVQHYDGTVGEYELEAWNDMVLIDAEPPEDWSGSLDMAPEDCIIDSDDRSTDRYGNPLDELLDS